MKILIAIDGSDASQSVIEAVCPLIAKPESAEVKIISVVEPIAPMVAEPFAISAAYYEEIQEGAIQQAKTFVEKAGADLKGNCPNISNVSSEVLRGAATSTIVEIAEEWNADLIVVGSRGYGFWSRTLLGSVSNAVVHHAPCSVLIVRAENEA